MALDDPAKWQNISRANFQGDRKVQSPQMVTLHLTSLLHMHRERIRSVHWRGLLQQSVNELSFPKGKEDDRVVILPIFKGKPSYL